MGRKTKMPIEWHKKCLANWLATNERERERIKRLQEDLTRNDLLAKHLANQIAEAERRGLDSFDDDRFLKRR